MSKSELQKCSKPVLRFGMLKKQLLVSVTRTDVGAGLCILDFLLHLIDVQQDGNSF
jgi:hypothetical protein